MNQDTSRLKDKTEEWDMRPGHMNIIQTSPGNFVPEGSMRTFETGATRNADQSRIDPEGFLSPLVLRFYANYMNKNRVQADGSVRASDNWQKGIPLDSYMKSMWRHFMEVWEHHRGVGKNGNVDDALGGLLFNVMGMIHEREKAKLARTPEEFIDLSKRTEENPWGPLMVTGSNRIAPGEAPVREQMDPVTITVTPQPDETFRFHPVAPGQVDRT